MKFLFFVSSSRAAPGLDFTNNRRSVEIILVVIAFFAVFSDVETSEFDFLSRPQANKHFGDVGANDGARNEEQQRDTDGLELFPYLGLEDVVGHVVAQVNGQVGVGSVTGKTYPS